MAAQQTSYSLELTRAYSGDLASSRDIVIDAKLNGESVEMTYGSVVCLNSSDASKVMLAANTLTVAGVLVQAHNKEKQTTGLEAAEYGNVLSRGRFYAIVENAVTPDDPVHVRVVAGSGFLKGSLRTGAVSAATAPLASVRFLEAAGAGAICLCEINLSGPQNLAVDA